MRLLNFARSPQSYTTPFSLWVFLAHIVIGVLGTAPFPKPERIRSETVARTPRRLGSHAGRDPSARPAP